MKKIISAILLTSILVSNQFTYAAPPIYETTQTQYTSGGVEITTKKMLINSGFVTVNVAKADLKNKNLKLTLLKDKENIKELYTTKALTDKFNAVVGINGDFYSKDNSSSLGSSVGVEISDGELLSGYAVSSTQMGVGAQKEDGSFFFDYIDTLTTITAPNGEGDVIKTYNKFDSLSGIVMYDRLWGKLSIGSTGNLEEMVVEDGIVTAINHDIGPVEIPENGYVLSYLKDINSFIPDNFNVGDKVEIDRVISPDIEDDIFFALGGGTILVTEGQKAKITHSAGVREPRSAWGVDKKERYVYFVTVDGRTKNSVGVTLDEFSEILIDLGLYNAINLDGGGSTTMVAKKEGEENSSVINTPSDSSLRGVINGIGVVSNAKPGKASVLSVSAKDSYVFANTSVSLEVKALDKNHFGANIDKEKIKWTVSNNGGYVEDFVFYPTKAGNVTITAEYEGIKGNIDITVLDMPHSLSLSSKDVKLKSGEKLYITLRGYDKMGYSTLIDINHIGINVSDNILSFDENTIIANKKGTAIVTFSFGDVSTSMRIRIDGDESEKELPKDIEKTDEKNISKDIEKNSKNFSVALFGNTFYNKTILERAVTENLVRTASKNCDMIFFTGKNVNVKTELIPLYTTDKYSYVSYKGTSFFTLNNSNSSVHSSGKDQWKKFIEDIKETPDKNIFIIMPAKLNFSSKSEEEMFDNLICDYALEKGKDVYVFSNGVMEAYKKDGKHMFTVDGVGNLNKECVFDNAKYLKINSENGNITYSFEKLYK